MVLKSAQNIIIFNLTLSVSSLGIDFSLLVKSFEDWLEVFLGLVSHGFLSDGT